MPQPVHYNIMTSCDRNLLRYIPIQVVSMLTAMPEAEIDFYLFHRDMEPGDWAAIDAVCQAGGTVRLHPVRISEPEKYDYIAAGGGIWAGEAYYSLCAWQYLPETEDRVLYMDAGDVLFLDDIAPYYFAPFDDKLLIVHPTHYKRFIQKIPTGGMALFYLPFEEADLEQHYQEIMRYPALFNSGSYVINLDKMRRTGLTADDFAAFSDELRRLSPMMFWDQYDKTSYYWQGDQGFMSAAFLGDLKLIEPENRIDVDYRPYEFILSYYHNHEEDPPDYIPAVVHYAGTYIPKPWYVSLGEPLPRFSPAGKRELKLPPSFPRMEKWYQLWYASARQTDQLLTRLGF